jgi:aspartyl-tRNA(Asn)/glutamyl-tRNA(Gln) amidotransferase subunit C
LGIFLGIFPILTAAFVLLPFKNLPFHLAWVSVTFVYMEITPKMIDHLAHLSRLEFSPDKKESIRNDLARMVGFIEKLQEVDTAGVEPLLWMTDEQQVWRADDVQGSVSRENALRNAPLTDGTYFKVPTVIKK